MRCERPPTKRWKRPGPRSSPLARSRSFTSLLTALTAAVPQSGLVGQTPDTGCIRQSELAIGPVKLDAPLTTVQQRLGPPLSQKRSWSEDDGGRYDVLLLKYRDLDVDIGRGERVERLSTTTPRRTLPSGVRVGMSISEIGRRLGLTNLVNRLRGDTLSPIVCWGDDYNPDLAAVILVFSHDSTHERRLTKMQLTNYGP